MATRRTTKKEWPLGDLLRAGRGQMSIREAARRADLSESRWRQVEAGVQKLPGGIEVPVHPKAETLVAMAKAVSVDPAKALRMAGHDPKHYDWLLEEADQLPQGVAREWFDTLDRDEREAVLAELQRRHVDLELERRRKRA